MVITPHWRSVGECASAIAQSLTSVLARALFFQH